MTKCIFGCDPITKKRLDKKHFPTACNNKAVTEVKFIYGYLRSGPIVLFVPSCEEHRKYFLEGYMSSHILPRKRVIDTIKETLIKHGWKVGEFKP